MMWLWVIQIAFDVVMMGILYYLAKQLKSPTINESTSSMGDSENIMAQYLKDAEARFEVLKNRTDERLQALQKITEHAYRWMKQTAESGSLQAVSLTSSLEEQELRQLSTPNPKDIPTIAHLEEAQTRLSQQLQLDLKTLLREQIA